MIYALSEAVALYGFVLRFTGFTFSEVVSFYAVGHCPAAVLLPARAFE